MDNPQKPIVWTGLDISKDTFDACLLKTNGKMSHKAFENTPKGFARLQTWCQHTAPDAELRFALEATSTYGNGVAEFLVEADYFVSILNPAVVQLFGRSLNMGNKTDPQSAKIIALFAKQTSPTLWKMATPEIKLLQGLVRRRQTLLETRLQEDNRLQTPGHVKAVRTSLQKSLRFLDKEIAALDAQIKTHINNTPSLKADQELLTSIPGIAHLTAVTLLAELPDLSTCANASSLAAYAGLSPSETRSGTSVHKKTHITKRGRPQLRRCLYMPAISACRYNPFVKALYVRLTKRGHSGKSAVVAGMRKLLMLVYGVLKSRQPFDKDWQTCTATSEA